MDAGKPCDILEKLQAAVISLSHVVKIRSYGKAHRSEDGGKVIGPHAKQVQ
jgi:hypothetical protein